MRFGFDQDFHFPLNVEYQALFGIWAKRSFAGVCRGASECWKKAKTSGEVSPKSLRQLPPQETWRCLLNIKIDSSLDVKENICSKWLVVLGNRDSNNCKTIEVFLKSNKYLQLDIAPPVVSPLKSKETSIYFP